MAILRFASVCGALCLAALAACGGKGTTNTSGTTGGGSTTGGETGGAGTGGGGPGGASFMPAPHPPLPQVLSFGGPVLKSPKVQPLVYAGDPNASDMASFLQELTTSSFWSDATSEYGVGALTVLPAITLPGAAPSSITDQQLQELITSNTTGASPAWGPADASAIYLFVLPPGTIESDSNGSCCSDFDGYHDEAPVNGGHVAYAISCACHGYDGPNVSDVNQRTVNISHELVEAATDPFPNTNTAYGQEDDADIVWTLVSGGEVADMCEFNQDSYFIPPGAHYMIQRSWSNAAAKKGTNPCVPVDTTAPFFNSYPVLPDMVALTGLGVPITTEGVKLAVGQSKTIDITLSSDAPTSGPWKVSAFDFNYLITGNKASADLDLTLDKDTGINGDTLHLTIKVNSLESMLGGGAAFILFSDLGGQENVSMGFVGG